MAKQVLVLLVFFKFEIEHCQRELGAVHAAIRQPFKRAMHTGRSIAFVVITSETEITLVNRLESVLSASNILDYWCFAAPESVVSSQGTLDSLSVYIKLARSEIGQRFNPKNMTKIQVRSRRPKINFGKDKISSAPIDMSRKNAPKWRQS